MRWSKAHVEMLAHLSASFAEVSLAAVVLPLLLDVKMTSASILLASSFHVRGWDVKYSLKTLLGIIGYVAVSICLLVYSNPVVLMIVRTVVFILIFAAIFLTLTSTTRLSAAAKGFAIAGGAYWVLVLVIDINLNHELPTTTLLRQLCRVVMDDDKEVQLTPGNRVMSGYHVFVAIGHCFVTLGLATIGAALAGSTREVNHGERPKNV